MDQRVTTMLSFRRIFPMAFLTMLFVLAVLQCSYIDPDFWWHLRTGQDIFLTRAIPHTDIYSFTKAGSEWVTHEWLSELLFFCIYRLSGWAGLIIILSGLITLAWYIVYRRCAGQPYVAAFAVLLGAVASAPLFGLRPQMLSMLLASIYVAVLSRFLKDGHTKRLYWLAPTMILWVNLHAGYAIGLGLIALYAVSAVLDGKRNLLRPLLILLVVSVAMVTVNANGIRMFSYPIETLTSPSMAAYIDEWASPDFHKFTFAPFAALLISLAVVLALSPKRPTAGDLFLLVVTAVGALRSVRHIPIFALIATPFLARHLWELMLSRGWERWFTKPEAPAVGATLMLNLIFLLAPTALATVKVWHFVVHRDQYEAKDFPVAAVNFLEQKQLSGPIYNQYGWGGYLIKRLYPKYRVYIDGRADVYGDAFMTEAMRTYDGRAGWRQPLDRLGVSTVLVSPDAPLASLLRDDTQWKNVYEDRQAVIFTRPSNQYVTSKTTTTGQPEEMTLPEESQK